MTERVRASVMIALELDTNLDAATFERRLESFFDLERLESELLDGEFVRVRDTTIEVNGTTPLDGSDEGASVDAWFCESCGGDVYSVEVLGRAELGRCRGCGLPSRREVS